MNVTVAATHKKVVMIEAAAKEVPDKVMYEASSRPTRSSSPSWTSST